ncbi:P-loop containing nucleoside triphosphate hydrolase protein [Neolentinus lepideus HHB14362 ss-1]|uniref:Midasin n=1 Tax=Neolentinus lepideus HHB14362 ss-1 TaxID=1314782 RepID=A0A165NDL4_9AGAM|nr:P-loop containing nucleoside triphosphate hydrolase protein [Neolentinus lepideus HHB14362 ss-1]
MDLVTTIHDPSTINWKKQTRVLLSTIPADSPHAAALQQISSPEQLLALLSRLLYVPSLTLLVADTFRPILLELCIRWLDDGSDAEEKFVALCLLIQPHEELFYIFLQFLRQWIPKDGPLAFLVSAPSLDEDGPHRLHALLVAYYRILQANRLLPDQLLWSASYLAKLFYTPHSDRGACLLAIRCYSLHVGMGEAEREKLEQQILGELCGEDCPVSFGEDVNGLRKEIDGWMLPAVEEYRLSKARNAIAQEWQDYYATEGQETVEPLSLSPRLANFHGMLLLRSSGGPPQPSHLIHTTTARDALRAITLRLSTRLPVLLTSPPSSGKSLLLSYLASTLYPEVPNQLVVIELADTSLDPRSLLGSYVSSPTSPGTFEWREGVLVRAMREGKWVVFRDIDRASTEVLGIIKPLVESLGMGKWIGGRAAMNVPNRGRVEADEEFAVFATRSVVESRPGKFPPAIFFGSNKLYEVVVPPPTAEELQSIIDSRFPRLAGIPARAFIRMWEATRALGNTPSTREIGVRELEKFCSRLVNLLPPSYHPMDMDMNDGAIPALSAIFPNPSLREEMYLEARDVFFAIEAATPSARSHNLAVAAKIGEELGLAPDRCQWVLNGRTPELDIEKDINGQVSVVRIGRTRLAAKPIIRGPVESVSTRPFAMHRPAVLLLNRIATAVSLREPVLLAGETGTGKTSVITHLAHLLSRPLISLNLSHQTESSDLLGGLKPVEARVPAYELHEQFTELFGLTFSRKKNAKFEGAVRKAVADAKWKRAAGLWKEAVRMAKERIEVKGEATPEAKISGDQLDSSAPRKRRRTHWNASSADWDAFYKRVQEFDVQFVQGKGKFAFSFVEGPLVKALRSGDWILLDEINLASSETLECISSLLHDPNGSITLTEQGHLEPVPRHPDFRLFACMNPATDVGKKDLPPTVRSRFTEIQVSPPDADRETLLSIVSQYIGSSAVNDKAAIMDVAEYYTAMKKLADGREVADGSNHRPHYSMRTLARALTFASNMTPSFGLRRALWEGCLMAFTMVLNGPSVEVAMSIAQNHLLSGVKNPRSLLSREPIPPPSESASKYVKLGPFYLEKGTISDEFVDDYIMTPSVEKKLVDLARIITTRRFPVLIEGPTSSGKTSSIEYLARRTGHRFVRINNHEHTDIQEYIGTYIPDPETGKLIFKDGLLVHALRYGHWVVLDELNLAPTDVLEALNRLLDDNRELMILETQEVIQPHPHFMLFATQNPPGLYGGRKVLSRAFRNRFLEVHFEDVPQAELETILCQRCRIAPSYGQRIVAVFGELRKRRQTSRVFESKHGFATLRDLFRWAGRAAIGYQELANDGYMLLAERARRADDKSVVKEVIESIMKVTIDEENIYDFGKPSTELSEYLGCRLPPQPGLIWTGAMRRLFVLLCRALKYNEPVLLVGETGSGKTSVCQVYAENISKHLHTINCHLNTETADLIGGLRPVRNRASAEAGVLEEVVALLRDIGITEDVFDIADAQTVLEALIRSSDISPGHLRVIQDARQKVIQATALFEWCDGPLIHAMKKGDVTLLDEISLADDSVLERLNSVLEPSRTIVLAEKGGEDIDQPVLRAVDDFKLVATMNPGGDYGKKELSPALRNRFTEIWVPPIVDRRDLEQIIHNLWQHEHLQAYTAPLLDFAEWIVDRVGDCTLLSLRDLLAWTSFLNSTYRPDDGASASPTELFHHAAHMTILDGLASLPQVASHSAQAIQRLKEEAILKLRSLVPLPEDLSLMHTPAYDASQFVQLGTFAIRKGSLPVRRHGFYLQAPTTLDNVMRVVRACQLPKPILLEGSPGVGKTSLITALANICGFKLHRINFSDQSDLIDLFGSDFPVEGGQPGEFVWKDADFLKAMREGSWVLLDEMNLAPQAVLEGLNAVLDHRGTVYIPELGRTFPRHPYFRVFAAQNPLHQGGGRKGLPKSFLNRFTKVYIEELSPQDLSLVCKHLFPDYSSDMLQAMISYNSRINEEITLRRSFATAGAPWEFNLRDVIRWGELLKGTEHLLHPVEHLRTVYLQRFRSQIDRDAASALFETVFQSQIPERSVPRWSLTPEYLQIGHAVLTRRKPLLNTRNPAIIPAQLGALETIGSCVNYGWLVILTGPRDSGKSTMIRLLSSLTGNQLHEVSVNSATDISDILGTFEQDDQEARARDVVAKILGLFSRVFSTPLGVALSMGDTVHSVIRALREVSSSKALASVLQSVRAVLEVILNLNDQKINLEASSVRHAVDDFFAGGHATGRFAWIDGPLVQAMKSGHWLLLDGANLCSPSVLDRLNSLCELGGVLTLNEKGQVAGQVETIVPHPQFRLFMSLDPQYGELSRAMRNRGVEISVAEREERRGLHSYFRIPEALHSTEGDVLLEHALHEIQRRGIHRAPNASGVNVSPLSPALVQSDSRLASVIRDAPLTPLLHRLEPVTSNALSYFFGYTFAPTRQRQYLRVLVSFVPESQVEKARRTAALTHQFTSDRLHQLHTHLVERLGAKWNFPQELLLAQPIEMFFNHSAKLMRENDDHLEREAIVNMLHLIGALQREDLRSNSDLPVSESWKLPVSTPGLTFEHHELRGLQEACALVQAIRTLTHRMVETYKPQQCKEAMDHIKIAVQLQEIVWYLARVTNTGHFDYSAASAVVQWIKDAVHIASPAFVDVVEAMKTLENSTSTNAGFGLSQIWSNLLGIGAVAEDVFRVNEVLCDPERLSLVKDRASIFSALAVRALNAGPSAMSDNASTLLSDQLKERLPDRNSGNMAPRHYPADPSLLMVELSALVTVGQFLAADGLRNVKQVIDLVCLYPGESLLRMLPYQHAIWAIDAELYRPSILAAVQKEWLQALWCASFEDHNFDGPSTLLHPVELYCSIIKSDGRRRPLSCINAYEASIRRHRTLIHSQRSNSASRLSQMVIVQLQSVLLAISSLVINSDDTSAQHDVQELRAALDGRTQEFAQRLVSFVEHSDNTSLKICFERHLRRTVLSLCDESQPRPATLEALGRSWIGLSRMLFDLYVPDVPLDPAAIKGCTIEFLQDICKVISEHINLQTSLEDHITGQNTNTVITILKNVLESNTARMARERLPLDRGAYDVSRVHAFWSEVWQFQTQVFAWQKVDAILSAVVASEPDAHLREQVLQESIIGFYHRLETAYPDLIDIARPLQLALLYMRLGLRIMTELSHESLESAYHLTSALVAFPSVHSSERILGLAHLQAPGLNGLSSPLLKLAAAVLDISAGADITAHLPLVNTLYDQICRLWLIDRAKEQEAEHASTSLYRQKDGKKNGTDEAELQEAEFQALFPNFDDIFDMEPSSEGSTDHRISAGVDISHVHILLKAHIHLFATSQMNEHTAPFFQNVRRHALQALVSHNYGGLPETLDADSLHYQLALLQDKLLGFTTSMPNRSLDFYRDSNIPEVKKAFDVLSSLGDRLNALIEDWPDQMVLQHLKSRCDFILTLDLESPVAKILSALEQLLLQTDDWEMFANRENTLHVHRMSLTSLIVEWRRYELSSWQGLLESQATVFEQEASQWWFRLYEAAVRGVLSFVDKPEGLDGYLQSLVPLLDEFIKSSPLGQFEKRMQLLGSFASFTSLLASSHDGRVKIVLSHSHVLLTNTWRYFSQFSDRIQLSLMQQRSILEKEINEFIKLASWKDINVQALKQSAKRTHHQLYKIIRKFKDILRQSIVPLLQSARIKPDDTVKNDHVEFSDSQPLVIQTFSPSNRSSGPEHLLNLNRTLQRFHSLIDGRMRPSLRSHNANSLNDLTTEIIATSQNLAAISIPRNLTSDKRVKQQKALLVRKRKAWIDLLKELKRIGFSANMKPEVLSRQNDCRWMREQPIISTVPAYLSAEKIDNYLDRLNTLLPELRGSLSNHNPDLTTRDLQRGIGFLESALSLALHARTRLAGAVQPYQCLLNALERLSMLRASPKGEEVGAEGVNTVTRLKVVLAKVASALEELLQEVRDSGSNGASEDAMWPIASHVERAVETTKVWQKSVRSVLHNVRLTSPAVVLQEEKRVIESGLVHLRELKTSLDDWIRGAPHLHYLFTGVMDLLVSQELPSTVTLCLGEPSGRDYSADSVVETLLIQVQSLLKFYPETSPAEHDEDGREHVYNTCRTVCDMTSSLKLDSLVQKLGNMLSYLGSASDEEANVELSRLIPFLDRYMLLLRDQLINHSYWTKTLLKLVFVLCNVMHTVATQGFCQPSESEEDVQGEGAEVDESGVGLGQGSGANDVSDQIEDENQIEGLRGDEPQEEENDESEEKGEGMEMNDDVEGELEDVPDRSEEDEEGTEDEQEDIDEQTGKLDASDPSAVDEKLWGDDGPNDDSQADQDDRDNARPEQQGKEEMVAKQDGKQLKDKKDAPSKDNSSQEEPMSEEQLQPENDEELPDESHPDASGAPMDEQVPEGDALDLPDDIDLGPEEKAATMGDEDEDMLSDEGDEAGPDDLVDDTPGSLDEGETDIPQSPPIETDQPDNHPEASGEQQDDAVAQPDLHAGDGHAQNDMTGPTPQEEAQVGESEDQSGGTGAQGSAGKDGDVEQQSSETAAADQTMAGESDAKDAEKSDESRDNAASSTGVRKQGNAPSELTAAITTNPLRDLGEALKEIQRRFADIQESSDGSDAPIEKLGDTAQPSQVEYLHPDDADQDMQALGPAAGEEVAQLSQLNIVDEEQKRDGGDVPMDVDEPTREEPSRSVADRMELHAEPTGEALQYDLESALTGNIQDASLIARPPADLAGPEATEEGEDITPAEEEALSAQTDSLLQSYLSAHDHETAQSLWTHYSHLTLHLSSILCEQLRLILEPTRATRLKGDYRMGKRLNMKKIIPYIASEYTKDKIWLRRMRPSEREYQVLLALDDSRSMRESRSVGLAFKTLALVAKALGKLEVGEVGIARFGEGVEVLHGFDGVQGAFNDSVGAGIVEAFTFAQKATDVLRLVETSLKVLEEARERKASGHGSELWQLEIIISDGICQDHEKLRRVLRKAEEMKVMIVFIVLDSLHTQTRIGAGIGGTDANANSILSMNQVSYKPTEDGRMELQMERYLDSFPFEYYVVLRDVEALPEVLSGTLKQFFERVSEE